MKMTGRKPLPASLIDAAEHKRSAEEIAARKKAEESLQTKATLKCPSHLSDEAKKEWRRVLKLYRSMKTNILCDLDLQALIMYCEATAIYKRAQQTWTFFNVVVALTPAKQKILDKSFAVMEKQARLISGLSEQLCLTPVGRARMGMNAAKDKKPSDLEQLFDGDD